MVGDVLDFVGDRPRIRGAQTRQGVCKGVSCDVHAQDGGRYPRLELRSQFRNQAFGLERRVTGRLRTERIEMRREVAVHAVRLHECHRGGDGPEQLVGDGLGQGRRSFGSCSRLDGGRCCRRMAVSRGLEQPGQTWMSRDDLAVAALEEPAPFGWDRLRVLEVFLEQVAREARVQAVDVSHYVLCSNEPATRGDGS